MAAKGQAAVTIVALGTELDLATQMRAQPLKRVDGGWPKGLRLRAKRAKLSRVSTTSPALVVAATGTSAAAASPHHWAIRNG
jgi:hypothetical protein